MVWGSQWWSMIEINVLVWFYSSKTLTCCLVWVDGEADGTTVGADVAQGLLFRVGMWMHRPDNLKDLILSRPPVYNKYNHKSVKYNLT